MGRSSAAHTGLHTCFNFHSLIPSIYKIRSRKHQYKRLSLDDGILKGHVPRDYPLQNGGEDQWSGSGGPSTAYLHFVRVHVCVRACRETHMHGWMCVRKGPSAVPCRSTQTILPELSTKEKCEKACANLRKDECSGAGTRV
jgi:hypothetical protein